MTKKAFILSLGKADENCIGNSGVKMIEKVLKVEARIEIFGLDEVYKGVFR